MPCPCASCSPPSPARASATSRPSSCAGAWLWNSRTMSSPPAPCARWELPRAWDPPGGWVGALGCHITDPTGIWHSRRNLLPREGGGDSDRDTAAFLPLSLCSVLPGVPLHQGHLLPGRGAGAAHHLDHPLHLLPRCEYLGRAWGITREGMRDIPWLMRLCPACGETCCRGTWRQSPLSPQDSPRLPVPVSAVPRVLNY